MMTRLTITSGTSLAHSQSHPMDGSIPCGWIHETLRITPTRNSSILLAPTAALLGRLILQSATPLILSKATRSKIKSAITSLSYQTTPAATLPIRPPTISIQPVASTKRIFITCAYSRLEVAHLHRHRQLRQHLPPLLHRPPRQRLRRAVLLVLRQGRRPRRDPGRRPDCVPHLL